MRYYACNDTLVERLLQDPRYEVREDGTIWRNGKQTGLAKTDKKGKTYRHLKYQGSNLLVHRIVYRKFHGPLDSYLVINHIDGDSLNNTASNLEMITQHENVIHGVYTCG